MACARAIGTETKVLRDIFDEHPGVRDRFVGTGIVTTVGAVTMLVGGFAQAGQMNQWDQEFVRSVEVVPFIVPPALKMYWKCAALGTFSEP